MPTIPNYISDEQVEKYILLNIEKLKRGER